MRKLLVLAGPPCAGKSTIGGLVEKNMGFRWLQADRILSNMIPKSDRRKNHRNIAYRAMHLVAWELLHCGQSVVVDATYASSEHRKSVEALAVDANALLYLIECRVRPEIAVARFEARGDHPAGDLTKVRVGDLASRYPYSRLGITLEAETSTITALQSVQDYVRAANPIVVDGRWSAAAIGYSS